MGAASGDCSAGPLHPTHRGVQLGIGIASDTARPQGGALARPTKTRTSAIAYLRTSSANNVGADKDSEKRQLHSSSWYASSSASITTPQ